MTNTENRFMRNGVLYVASNEAIQHNCIGCAGEYDASLCANAPPCSYKLRKDGRNVIFVKSDTDNQGGE